MIRLRTSEIRGLRMPDEDELGLKYCACGCGRLIRNSSKTVKYYNARHQRSHASRIYRDRQKEKAGWVFVPYSVRVANRGASRATLDKRRLLVRFAGLFYRWVVDSDFSEGGWFGRKDFAVAFAGLSEAELNKLWVCRYYNLMLLGLEGEGIIGTRPHPVNRVGKEYRLLDKNVEYLIDGD